MLLAGDVGATKTNLAIFSEDEGPHEPLIEATYSSADYPNLQSLAVEFIRTAEFSIDRASIGVAGPVVEGRATITNLSWDIDEGELAEGLGLTSVTLLNDLVAIATAVPILEPDDLDLLTDDRQPEAAGAIAVVAPGTGLGQAFLVWTGSRYQACPSEGGHADFAPNTPFECGLWRYLHDRFGHVSVERVCSGLGIPNIYTFLRDSSEFDEPAWLADQLAGAEDPTPIIVNAALDGHRSCELCSATLDAFVSILGSEAGSLALRVVATGGVYLGGGIPPRILPALRRDRFLESFQGKGRMAGLLSQIPVKVILNPKAAILGAATHGLRR
jgi:glucokinase